MTTTVYFATNRVVNHPADRHGSYTSGMVSPDNPLQVTYGTAFVDSAGLTADKTGAINSIQDLQKGDFSPTAFADLADGGRNILVFIHGFANSFENAITRAAFNREWFADCGVADADTAVVAFSWPSRGEVITPPFPTFAYRSDQKAAGNSGMHLMRFFSNLLPILEKARNNGRRTFLLAHSMGNLALQGAVETWFANGNGDARLFDEAILAAPDVVDSALAAPGPLSSLNRLARRISILYSNGDKVLDILSENLNGATRLGQDGPRSRDDVTLFPAATYRMVDCGGFTDYDADFQGSHQYYRRSKGVRKEIAALMAP